MAAEEPMSDAERASIAESLRARNQGIARIGFAIFTGFHLVDLVMDRFVVIGEFQARVLLISHLFCLVLSLTVYLLTPRFPKLLINSILPAQVLMLVCYLLLMWLDLQAPYYS